MALAATIEWEVRTTGTASNVNGGGYKPGSSGSDFSQQNAAQYDLTGVTTAAADAILLSASAAADMVGNIAHINSGTNFTVGWYEIISVVVGTSITLDRTCTTAAGSAGAVKIGGALNFGALDDALFETMEPGNTVHIKSGTYTMSAISLVKDGTAALPINIRGYNTSRNDNPAFGSQPTLAFAGNASTFGDYFDVRNITVTTTAASGLASGTGSILHNCKSTNSSATAGRYALAGTTALDGIRIIRCEGVSTNGYAAAMAGSNSGNSVIGCYLHDSDVGVFTNTGDANIISFNIIDTCATGISLGSISNHNVFENNTLYGAATPAGTGILLAATTGINNTFMNNIIYGFTTGVNSNTAVGNNFYNYNNIFNCTTPRTNVTAGPNDTALDPQFTDAPNGNFTVGANMKAIGFPGAFPGGLTTGYLDIGAVQRVEPTGGSGGGARILGAGIVSGG